MSWIGLRHSTDAILQPSGLGAPNTGFVPDLDAFLAEGTLLIEYRYAPSDKPVNILRYARRDPTAAVITLRSDPDGTLSLLMRQGGQDALYSLKLPAAMQGEPVVVHYVWDTARNLGAFSARLSERGLQSIAEIKSPLPLGWRDAQHITADLGRCQMLPEVQMAAVADQIAPIGPQPCLDGAGHVQTPNGRRILHQLRHGDMVVAADGAPAQVRWIGAAHLLTHGHHAPCLLRAPYFGAESDLTLSAAAVLRLSGSEVEYLFGEPEVAVPVRHLADGQAILSLRPKSGQPQNRAGLLAIRQYYQVLLDRAVPLRVSGVAITALDTEDILRDPVLHRWSILAGMPLELLPRVANAPCMQLRDYEAQTLRQMQAA